MDEQAKIVLRYIGNGAFIGGVPARDLTDADIKESGLTVEQIMAHAPLVYVAMSAVKEKKEVTHG